MISRGLKAFYYALFHIPMRLNGMIYKTFRAPSKGVVKVHLGPGTIKYFPGWINVDANLFTAKIDVWADLSNPLPFRDQSVDVFYSHHVIEHFPDLFLPTHFKDMFRCLKPGGFVRIGGPNGETAIRKFLEGDASWFPDFPDKRTSVGGRFVNFIICRNEHLTILTSSYLEELLSAVGFVNIKQCRATAETFHPQQIDESVLKKEWGGPADAPYTLIVEAEKPPQSGTETKT